MDLHLLIFVFGILGNIISFMVYLAPVPTFWRVCKKKSTEGFQSLPYVCAIFSSMLWIYYALLKTNSLLLVTINGAGCVIETVYVAIFLTYAPKQAKMATMKLLIGMNLLGFSSIVLACNYLVKVSIRVPVMGWLCVAFAVVVFAAPLSIIRSVIRTKSVEFMPLPLSLSLTISAVMWFMYGLLQKDLYIVLPNVLGFTFGVAQMVLYGIYRKRDTLGEDVEEKVPAEETADCIINVPELELHRICSLAKVIDQSTSATKEKDATSTVEDNKCTGIDGGGGGNERNIRQLRVHVPSSCGLDEIQAASPATPTTTTVQVMACAG